MDRHLSIEELERYRVLAAYLVLQFGPEFGFVLDRVERMLEQARREDLTVRALKIVQELRLVSGRDPVQLPMPQKRLGGRN